VYQAWRNLTFLHWRYPPEVLAPRLPPGVKIDTFDGSAWLRIAPFRLELRADAFPETNCLTYVRGPDGQQGVWFFSLDAARLLAVAGARIGFGLPYMWSRMRMHSNRYAADYSSRRRWPDRQGMTNISVQRGETVEAGELETFLTMRLRLYNVLRGRLIKVEVEHGPWPLESARVVKLEQTLTATVGLPDPQGEPLVHFSTGVEVKVGRPKPVS
jgi:uncharacterized protein YqjF (DUF2071 family)